MERRRKRLTAMLLALTMCLSLLPGSVLAAETEAASQPVTLDDATVTASGTCGEKLTWTLTSDGILTVSGEGNMDSYESYSQAAPWYSYANEIKQVVIEDGVTSIGDSTFAYCGSMTGVTIPDSVTSIGEYAFYGCGSLTDMTIPSAVTSIGEYAFYVCSSLTSVTIPDGVTGIGNSAFAGCSSLTSVMIPDSVTSIGNSAFASCSSLTSVEIGNSVTGIGNSAFANCSSLTDITIPDSVTSIGNSAFVGCSSLTDITIPDSVTSIGDYVFKECSSLTSVEIGNSVTSIGYAAFRKCTSLTGITIPDSVTSIGNYAFEECTSLTGITIPDSVTSIGNHAFNNCTSLTGVTIPDSVTSIGNSAFRKCSSLTDIMLPDGITSIGSYLFYDCSSLTNIEIPDSVTSIGQYAFNSCSNLTSVKISNSLTSIGNDAFAKCASLTSVTIPDSVTSIGSYAFWYCTGLTSIAIPDSVVSIGDFAFRKCTSLTSVTIPDSETSIGNYAFSCTGLTSVTIPAGVTSIGDHAFEECTSLTDISVDEGNKNYSSQNGALLNKAGTELICCPDGKEGRYTIPDSVTSIGSYAFSYCRSLISVTIPDSVTSIGDSAFDYCSSLTSIAIPDSVASIGNSAFNYCRSLISVTIPDSVTSIGNYAFNDCRSLISVTIPEGVTSIGTSAFQNCDNLTIYGYTNTAAETYANDNNIPFVSLDNGPINLTAAVVTLSQTSYTYAGTAREPAVTVTVNGITLAPGTDYTVAYSDNKNVGTATVTVTGIGNYTGTAKTTFTIKAADLTACTATLSAASYTYSGSARKPTVTVRTAKGTKLTEGTNYQVSYTDNVNAGTATVTITGINNYAGTIVQHFTIQKASLSACTVKRGDTTRVVNGVTVPNVVVTTAKGTKLKEGTNYSVSYTVENGVGVATVTGINNYTGTKTLTFTPLTDINQGTVTMSFTIATYSGNQKRPAVTVKDANGNTLKKGQDYTVTYQNTTNVGKGKVIITGIGDYCGTVTKTLTIRPKAPTDLQIVSTTKTTAKISFTRDTTADKYYIYVDGKYVGAALTVDYYTIKGLTSGTTYKVTVKAVKVVDGSNIYSLSSSTLTVKTK